MKLLISAYRFEGGAHAETLEQLDAQLNSWTKDCSPDYISTFSICISAPWDADGRPQKPSFTFKVGRAGRVEGIPNLEEPIYTGWELIKQRRYYSTLGNSSSYESWQKKRFIENKKNIEEVIKEIIINGQCLQNYFSRLDVVLDCEERALVGLSRPHNQQRPNKEEV